MRVAGSANDGLPQGEARTSNSPGDMPSTHGLRIHIKYAKIAFGTTVRWQRKRKQETKEGGKKAGGKATKKKRTKTRSRT